MLNPAYDERQHAFLYLKKGSMFFFKKKNQKTFAHLALPCPAEPGRYYEKFPLFFKNEGLASPNDVPGAACYSTRR
jgi:hypothetical protein